MEKVDASVTQVAKECSAVEDAEAQLVDMLIAHIEKGINAPSVPPLPPELARIERFVRLDETIRELRDYLVRVANGDLSQDFFLRGFMAGLLKQHVANLRHLTWQVEQVSRGDFSQRVDFMGEFSTSFNNMVMQLDATLNKLRETKEHLTRLTNTLKHEVEMRSAAVRALEKSRARFQYLADHDPLTGALNRRSFLQIAEESMVDAHSRGAPCCVAMLDVDHFKRFNDTHGHIAGDAALKHVVEVSTHALRQKDSMGRYGGEEFIFFFADTEASIAEKVADRIRKAIKDNPVALESGQTAVTVSMGAAVVLPEWAGERNAAFLQKVINMADVSLYRAKQAGRDRVSMAPLIHPDLFQEEAARLENSATCGCPPVESKEAAGESEND